MDASPDEAAWREVPEGPEEPEADVADWISEDLKSAPISGCIKTKTFKDKARLKQVIWSLSHLRPLLIRTPIMACSVFLASALRDSNCSTMGMRLGMRHAAHALCCPPQRAGRRRCNGQ
eukprot:15435163-Alexandrium_andersonii.AAC.1